MTAASSRSWKSHRGSELACCQPTIFRRPAALRSSTAPALCCDLTLVVEGVPSRRTGVESTPRHNRVLRAGKRSAKRTGCRSRRRSLPTRSAGAEPQSSNYASSASTCSTKGQKRRSPPTFRSPGFDRDTFPPTPGPVNSDVPVGSGKHRSQPHWCPEPTYHASS
jgi:hypothetical protein